MEDDLAQRVKALEHFAVLVASAVPAEAWARVADEVLPKHQAANPPAEWRRYLEALVEAAARLQRDPPAG